MGAEPIVHQGVLFRTSVSETLHVGENLNHRIAAQLQILTTRWLCRALRSTVETYLIVVGPSPSRLRFCPLGSN